MEPRFETFTDKTLVGKRLTMSFNNNRTRDLWQSFMPYRADILANTGTDLYSVEVYKPHFFDHFDPAAEFEKWAAVQVSNIDSLPPGMEALLIPAGLYAVFTYKGPASQGQKIYRYIFTAWLPGSGYELDDRPHFALMGPKYKHEDPSSEEEIWIPVKKT